MIRFRLVVFSILVKLYVDAELTVTDCFNVVYRSTVVTNTFDVTTMDPVTACAGLVDHGEHNYMPFTLCNQKLWKSAEMEIYKSIAPGNRLFIGLGDAYETMDYQFMADGGLVLEDTLHYFIDSNDTGDTRNSCVALQFPKERMWRTPKCTDPNTPYYFICEVEVCPSNWKSLILAQLNSLCYTTDNLKNFTEAGNECTNLGGNLLRLSTLDKFNDAVTLIAKDMASRAFEQRGIVIWLEDFSCQSWGNGFYMERVTCTFKLGDKYLCMTNNPSSKITGSYKGCYNISSSNTTNGGLLPVVTTEMMQVRFCISLCQGQNKRLAGLRNTDCFCFDNISTSAASELCNITCPGNPSQPCGAANSMSIFDSGSYLEPIGNKCTDYYNMGFYPPAGQTVTYRSNNGKFINCSLEIQNTSDRTVIQSCPSGWVMFNSGCLYFGHDEVTSDEAHRICQTMQGDLAHLQSRNKLKFVKMTVKRPRPFSQHDAWHFGVYRIKSNLAWTWRDGRPMRTFNHFTDFGVTNDSTDGMKDDLSDNLTSTAAVMSYTLRKNYKIIDNVSIVDSQKVSAFVCSLNEMFLGQRIPILDDGFVATHQSTEKMSVTGCIQICLLSSRRQIAQVFSDTCICSLDTIVTVSNQSLADGDFECESPIICSGHNGQICGCDDKASFYYTDPKLTQRYYNCDELNANGVGINGVYTVEDRSINALNNLTILCLFSGGKCPDTMPYSYRNKCFSIDGQPQIYSDAFKYCQDKNWKSNLAVPNDEDEERFLIHLIKTINGHQNHSWLGLGTTIKGSDGNERKYQCPYLAPEISQRKQSDDCRKLKVAICEMGK